MTNTSPKWLGRAKHASAGTSLKTLLLGAVLGLAGMGADKAQAVEGGTGAYLMGTRDTLAGIVPPPGTYLSFTYDRIDGDVQGLSVGGLPIRANANVAINLYRFSATQAFDAELWGGRPAINVTIPIPDVSLSFTGVTAPLAGASISDSTSGFGDIAVSGLLGWNSGMLNYSAGLTIYAPTGSYNAATVSAAPPSINALSNGKNVWSFQPTVAATWLNPKTGLEFSGAASLLFSTKNSTTNYQTAPAIQLEGAVVQRLPSGWGLGLTAYHYEQLRNDSGAGAAGTQAALGASSLRARVSGVGPMVVYSGGKLFGGNMSLKAKYVHEFGAKRRIESDTFTFSISLAY